MTDTLLPGLIRSVPPPFPKATLDPLKAEIAAWFCTEFRISFPPEDILYVDPERADIVEALSMEMVPPFAVKVAPVNALITPPVSPVTVTKALLLEVTLQGFAREINEGEKLTEALTFLPEKLALAPPMDISPRTGKAGTRV
nr:MULTISPECIES: hypothetical protein [unclassified Gluconobacter]